MNELVLELHHFIQSFASLAVSVIEFIALVIVIYVVVRALVVYVKDFGFDLSKMHADNSIIEGLNVALELLLAGEILKTVTATTKETILEIFFIFAIRLFMTIDLHWESKTKHEHDHEAHPEAKEEKKA